MKKRSRAFRAKEALNVEHSLPLSTHNCSSRKWLAESRRRYLEHLSAQGAATDAAVDVSRLQSAMARDQAIL
jgi:hypothetical protein